MKLDQDCCKTKGLDLEKYPDFTVCAIEAPLGEDFGHDEEVRRCTLASFCLFTYQAIPQPELSSLSVSIDAENNAPTDIVTEWSSLLSLSRSGSSCSQGNGRRF